MRLTNLNGQPISVRQAATNAQLAIDSLKADLGAASRPATTAIIPDSVVHARIQRIIHTPDAMDPNRVARAKAFIGLSQNSPLEAQDYASKNPSVGDDMYAYHRLQEAQSKQLRAPSRHQAMRASPSN